MSAHANDDVDNVMSLLVHLVSSADRLWHKKKRKKSDKYNDTRER